MNWAGALGLSADDLLGQRVFLLDRAESHLQQVDSRRRLLAATLLRDAAAISIILGDFIESKQLLKKSGATYLSEGMLYGLMLSRVAGDQMPWISYGQVMALLRMYFDYGHLESAVPQDVPALHVTQSELVSVLQSFVAAPPGTWRSKRRDRVGDRWLFDRVVDAVEGRLGAQDADTPRPIYLQALVELARTTDLKVSTTLPARYLNAAATGREADLNAARKDVFNWSLVSNPSDLVDFDLIVLTMAMMERGLDKQVDEIFGAPDQAVAIPIVAARALRAPPDPSSD